MFFLSLIPSLGIFFEDRNRIKDYVIFSIPRIIEGIIDMLNKIGFPVKIDHLLNLIFSLSMAFALLISNKYPELVPKSYSKVLNMVYS